MSNCSALSPCPPWAPLAGNLKSEGSLGFGDGEEKKAVCRCVARIAQATEGKMPLSRLLVQVRLHFRGHMQGAGEGVGEGAVGGGHMLHACGDVQSRMGCF